MPNLTKIPLFFLFVFLFCQFGDVFGIKCYSTVEKLKRKSGKKNAIIFGGRKIDWKEMQTGFWDTVSVDKATGVLVNQHGEADMDSCLVMTYQIIPYHPADVKRYKMWNSWGSGSFCESEERRTAEQWVEEAGGFNFKCWTCNHKNYCNDAGPKIKCYDTTNVDVLSGVKNVYWAIKANFREVASAYDSANIGGEKHCPAYSGCLTQSYQKGSKYMVWKSCGTAVPNYCETGLKEQIEKKVIENGGHNFWCSACDHSHKCNSKFPTTTTTTTTTSTTTTTTTTTTPTTTTSTTTPTTTTSTTTPTTTTSTTTPTTTTSTTTPTTTTSTTTPTTTTSTTTPTTMTSTATLATTPVTTTPKTMTTPATPITTTDTSETTTDETTAQASTIIETATNLTPKTSESTDEDIHRFTGTFAAIRFGG